MTDDLGAAAALGWRSERTVFLDWVGSYLGPRVQYKVS